MLNLHSTESTCVSQTYPPGVRPAVPKLSTLKTFNIPPQKVEDIITSATSALPTPTSELLGGHPFRVLIAPSGFKESLGPEHVADAIEAGFRKVVDGSSIIMHKLPLHDGGEGFCRALVAAQNGIIVDQQVTGPVGRPVESHFGVIGEDCKIAVLDMAAAAGLRLVPNDMRDPTATTTYGVGELMKKALDDGCTKIIVGCGDSGTSDGGAGMLQALGVRLLDVNGEELPRADGGRSLCRLKELDWSSIHSRLHKNSGNLLIWIFISSLIYDRFENTNRGSLQRQERALRTTRRRSSIRSSERCHAGAGPPALSWVRQAVTGGCKLPEERYFYCAWERSIRWPRCGLDYAWRQHASTERGHQRVF